MIKCIEKNNYQDYTFWFTSTKKVGISFVSHPLDYELIDVQNFEHEFKDFLRYLDEDIKVRIAFYSDYKKENIENLQSENTETTSLITENHLVFHFENGISLKDSLRLKNQEIKDKLCFELIEKIQLNLLYQIGFDLENITEIDPFFWDINQPLIQSEMSLDSGFEKIGVIKLLKPSHHILFLQKLSELQFLLPKPYEIQIQLTKIPQTLAKIKFSQAAKREAQSSSQSGQTKAIVADQAMQGMEFEGDAYFNFEWHFILRRKHLELLKNDMKAAFFELKNFAEFYIESIGVFPSFYSTQLGSDFHFKGLFNQLIEKDENLTCYLPLVSFGTQTKEKFNDHEILFHRYDGSLDSFSPFQIENKNANLNIIGASGKGKSVFINRKIQKDYLNPEATLIIVDVKGSHTRLVKMLEGDIFEIDLNSSTGINPFEFFKINKNDKTIDTVKTFLSELCLDESESKLNDLEGADLEDYLIQYVSSLNESSKYSIDEFLDFVDDSFSRKKLLKRYSKKGLLKHIFSSSDEENMFKQKKTRSRLRYYNFKSIDIAANKSITRSILAAIMADAAFTFNNRKINEKVIFISDETPFFIKHCFRSFTFLSKNLRALNGSLVITVQLSTDLIVDNDYSLITNAESTVLFNTDHEKESFKSRFQLTEDQYLQIYNLKSNPGVFSRFVIKDGKGFRVATLFLSRKEYWISTNRPIDTVIIEQLKSHFPDLEEQVIIELISKSRHPNYEIKEAFTK